MGRVGQCTLCGKVDKTYSILEIEVYDCLEFI
jgi:hypothetical protein